MKLKPKKNIKFAMAEIIFTVLGSIALILFFSTNMITREIVKKNYNEKKEMAVSSITETFQMSMKSIRNFDKKYVLGINKLFDSIEKIYIKNKSLPTEIFEEQETFHDLEALFRSLNFPIPEMHFILFDKSKEVLYHSEMKSDEYLKLKNAFLTLIKSSNKKVVFDNFNSSSSKYAILNLDDYIFGVELKMEEDELAKDAERFKNHLLKQYEIIESITIFNIEDIKKELTKEEIEDLNAKKQVVKKEKLKETYYLPMDNNKVIKIIFNEKTIYQDIIPLYVAFVISVLISILIGIFVAKRKAQPLINSIESISDSIREYTEKKDMTKISEIKLAKNAPYELINLSNGLNEMTQEISAYTEELQAINEELTNSYKEIEEKNKKLKEQNYYFSKQLSKIAESYDDDTGNHIDRVAVISGFIAEKLNLDKLLIQDIKHYAPLHDIGKILVPIDILRKPGKLTDKEYEIIKKHPIDGAGLIGYGEEYKVARNIAMYHHEKYNGKGYPFGKSGSQIPIEAQIVAFADVYDALRSERPYKKGFTHEMVYDIFLNGDGRTTPDDFNPLILDIFKKYHKDIEKIYNSLL